MWGERARQDLGERVKSEDGGHEERAKPVEPGGRERRPQSDRWMIERRCTLSQGHVLLKNQFTKMRKSYFLPDVK